MFGEPRRESLYCMSCGTEDTRAKSELVGAFRFCECGSMRFSSRQPTEEELEAMKQRRFNRAASGLTKIELPAEPADPSVEWKLTKEDRKYLFQLGVMSAHEAFEEAA